MGKMSIEDFKNMVNSIVKTDTDKQIESKVVEALTPYFVDPPAKYLIGLAAAGTIFNIGNCGKQTHEYTLLLLDKGILDGCLCIGESSLFNEEKLNHIWLEMENNYVYEGSLNRFFNKEEYYELASINKIGEIPLSEKENIKHQIEKTKQFFMNEKIQQIEIDKLKKHFIKPEGQYLIGLATESNKFNIGNCGKMSKAYALQLLDKGLTNGYLCYGYINILGLKQVNHLWIELENKYIFEGLFQSFYSIEDYYKLFKAEIMRKVPISDLLKKSE